MDILEKRLIEALERVEAHGDVAPVHVHDPMTMLLRENPIQAHLMRWDDARGRYVLTGTGRRRISAGGRVPGTVVSFRRRGVVNGPSPERGSGKSPHTIAIFLGWACLAFGRVRVSTPSSRLALIFSWSTVLPRVKERA